MFERSAVSHPDSRSPEICREISRRDWRSLAGFGWILLSLLSGDMGSARAESIAPSRIEQLMRTPPHLAAERPEVRVIGLVSAVGDGLAAEGNRPPGESFFCVEQDSVGIWVRTAAAIRDGLLTNTAVLADLKCGTKVEIEGVLDEGLFAPVLLPVRVSVLGTEPLPEPRRAVLRRFFRGADDVRRVSVIGVVQSMIEESPTRWLLRAETGSGHFLVRLPKRDEFSPSRLLDAEVDFTGLAAVSRNWRFEFVCPRLIIDRAEDIDIRTPPPADPFGAPKLRLRYLDGYHPDGRPLHRLRVEGTVTFQGPGRELYLQEDGCAIRVETNDEVDVVVGERVEVAGFIDTTRHVAGLRGAMVRKLEASASSVLTKPVPITMSQIDADYLRAAEGRGPRPISCDGRLVQIRGMLLSVHRSLSPPAYHLELECEDSVSTAWVPANAPERVGTRMPTPGSELLLTGIASLQYPPTVTSANLLKPTRLDLLLRSPEDITVLSQRSWWTVERVASLLMVALALAVAAVIWAFTLRRTVFRQTRLLAEQMRDRRDAVIEFQAALGERTRLAANLHDTLLQTVTGIGFQLEACGQSNRSRGEQLDRHLATARRMIEHCQDDLRSVVWTLHSLPLKAGSLGDSIRQLVRQIGDQCDSEIVVTCGEGLPKLADFVAGNVLLVIQEAILNAVKHASTRRIHVDVFTNAQRDRVEMTIRDGGCGFDPVSRLSAKDGHFGMAVMQQRVERLGGLLQVESEHEKGTTVHVQIPVLEFDPQLA